MGYISHMANSPNDASLEDLIAERYRLTAEGDRIQKRLASLTAAINARMANLMGQQQQQPQPPAQGDTPPGRDAST